MRVLRAIILLSICVLACTAGPANELDVDAVLKRQVAAWNRGDLPGFVETYAEHCTLVANKISHVTRGQVLDHYRKAYPDRNSMGVLAFSETAVQFLGERAAIVVGRWNLQRGRPNGGPITGYFSLVCEKRNGTWQIVLDHTSSL